MKIFIAAVLLFVTLASVAGCNRLKSMLTEEPRWKPVTEEPAAEKPTVEKPIPPSQERGDLLAYFNFLQRLTDVELGKEFRAVKQRYAGAADEDDRWRLIFLSILPGQPFSDRDYALELLRGRRVEKGPEHEPRAGLGRLLSLLLADQSELKRKLGEEKQRAEKLAQQLQELKEIETILSEREKKRPAAQ